MATHNRNEYPMLRNFELGRNSAGKACAGIALVMMTQAIVASSRKRPKHAKWKLSFLLGAMMASSFSSRSATPLARTTDHMEDMYRMAWREEMTRIHPPGIGCFHATYPSTIFERTSCQTASPHSFSLPPKTLQDTSKTVGNRQDYALGVPLSSDGNSNAISAVSGSFPSAKIAGNGPDQYSLQINTNSDSSTAACDGGSLCKVWQQFIYATDYPPGSHSGAGLFMEYWLNTYSLLGRCPDGWNHGADFSCFKDSPVTAVPYIPAADLADVHLIATAQGNEDDAVMLFYRDDVYASYNDDSVLDLSQIWKEAEFNIFGNGARSPLANFDQGTSITVKIGSRYPLYTKSPPICLPNMGTTAETNNLNLGPCVSIFSANPNFYPYIQFNESK